MNRMKLLALFLPFVATAAFAADSAPATSEYIHQAPAEKWEVTPVWRLWGQDTVKYDSTYLPTAAADKSVLSTMGLDVVGEYGINEMLSVGLKLGYESDENAYSTTGGTTTKTRIYGLLDPMLFLNGKVEAGPGNLRFGTTLAIPLSKPKIKDQSTAGDYTANDGSFVFTPYVGYEMMLGGGMIGAKLAYDVVRSDAKINSEASGTDNTLKGGNVLSFAVFYELDMKPVIWGFDVALYSISAQKMDTATQTGVDLKNGTTNFEIATYAAWELAEDITLLPRFTFGPTAPQSAIDSQLGGEKSRMGYGLSVGARFGF